MDRGKERTEQEKRMMPEEKLYKIIQIAYDLGYEAGLEERRKRGGSIERPRNKTSFY